MFSKALLVGALAAIAAAQSSVLSFTRVPSPITAGQAQALTYATNDTTSPVTIILRKGQAGDLDTIATLTDSATNGQYIWTPSSSLENDDDYALEIDQNGEVNYFGPFAIQGASGSGSSSSSSSSRSAGAYTSSSSSSRSASAYTTGTGAAAMNSTMTSTARPSFGTGLPTTRNSTNGTLTSATLTLTSSARPTSTASNTDDLNLGASATTGADAPANTGAAAMLGSSAIALAFGAAAAVLLG